MQTAGVTFETVEALRLVGMERRTWSNAMQRQLYREAPKVKAGHPRHFTRDDMIGLYVFRYFAELMGAPVAGGIASAIRKELRRKDSDSIDKLYVVLKGGSRCALARERPASEFSHEVDVQRCRQLIDRFAAEKLGVTGIAGHQT